jgi:hypothetical protein
VKAEGIGGERDGDFMDNCIILDVINIGRGLHSMHGWVHLFIEQVIILLLRHWPTILVYFPLLWRVHTP